MDIETLTFYGSGENEGKNIHFTLQSIGSVDIELTGVSLNEGAELVFNIPGLMMPLVRPAARFSNASQTTNQIMGQWKDECVRIMTRISPRGYDNLWSTLKDLVYVTCTVTGGERFEAERNPITEGRIE